MRRIPDGTIGKAGAALRDVAKLQQKYQGQMESASPTQKQGLSEKANAEAVQAIQSHGLSIQEYSTLFAPRRIIRRSSSACWTPPTRNSSATARLAKSCRPRSWPVDAEPRSGGRDVLTETVSPF